MFILQRIYGPRRKYRRLEPLNTADEEVRVQSTLLEYGRWGGISFISGLPGVTRQVTTESLIILWMYIVACWLAWSLGWNLIIKGVVIYQFRCR